MKLFPLHQEQKRFKDAVNKKQWENGLNVWRIPITVSVLQSVLILSRKSSGGLSGCHLQRNQEQILSEKEGRLPDAVLACIGGGSNAIGAFYNFIDDEGVRLIGCKRPAAEVSIQPGDSCNYLCWQGRYFPRHEKLLLPRRDSVKSHRFTRFLPGYDYPG